MPFLQKERKRDFVCILCFAMCKKKLKVTFCTELFYAWIERIEHLKENGTGDIGFGYPKKYECYKKP